MTTPRLLLAALAVSVTVMAAPPANAQPAAARPAAAQPAAARPAAAQPSAAADDGRGYEYRFIDDLLAGGGLDGSAPIIRVNPRALRSQLIRPRVSFVPELLKSGDAL